MRIHQDKLEAARRIFLCSGCPSKCSKCGTQLEVAHHSCEGAADNVFRFCEACGEEYEEYKKRKQGESGNKMFWHNDEWLALWDAWLDYQEAVTEYRNSKEFRQLLEDLNP
jgi:hypothetical protein